jgi:DNA-binding SARP family transcriptional activator
MAFRSSSGGGSHRFRADGGAHWSFGCSAPFELVAAGRGVDLGPAKQRILFAALAVDAGHPVATETLIDRIWDDAPPREPRNVLHTYVARSRRLLEQAHRQDDEPITLERRVDGYQLVMDVDRIDLHRFHRLVRQARAHDVHGPEWAALLAGMSGGWAARVREGLRQQRLGALADWADAELELGRPAPVIERLEEMVVQHPLAESLVVRLIQALRWAGRDAGAPGLREGAPENRRRTRRHARSRAPFAARGHPPRRGDRRPDAAAGSRTGVRPPRSPPQPHPPGRPRPAQFPVRVPAFTGRAAYLEQLDAMLPASGPDRGCRGVGDHRHRRGG